MFFHFPAKFMVRVLAVAGLSGIAALAQASPQLQLGIVDGVYDLGTETIVTASDNFEVVALGHATGNNAVSTSSPHYLSVAITPQQVQVAAPDFGSFVVGGTTYTAADMTFGTPPLSATANPFLGGHGVFSTYYLEIAFNFASGAANTVTDINTEDSPSTPLDTSGSDLYFVKFDVDKSGLIADFELHFDLYNTNVKNNGAITRGDFAPFSHDAGTVGGAVPEPGSLIVWTLLVAVVGTGTMRKAPRNV